MNDQKRIVGVIGGMGPEATVDLLQRIIRGTPARDDNDHIRTLVDNNPGVPSRIEFVLHGRGDSPAPVIVAMAKGLEAQGADFLVMPCNTAHLYAEAIRVAVGIPFINMIDVAASYIADSFPAIRRVGLLASSAVVQTGLYKDAFKESGIEVINPDDFLQQKIMALIKRVKAGEQGASDVDVLKAAALELATNNAQCLIIACTELSALGAALSLSIPVIDASQRLAEETIQRALGS